MKRIAVILALLLLNACASQPTRITGTGVVVEPPTGWYQYCGQHPDDVTCHTPVGPQPK